MIGESLCRLCQTPCTNASLDIFSATGIELNMLDILGEHFKCDIIESDQLPKTVCRICWKTTEQFHQLYVKSKIVREDFLDNLIRTGIETHCIEKTINGGEPILQMVAIKVEPIRVFEECEEYDTENNSAISFEVPSVDEVEQNQPKNRSKAGPIISERAQNRMRRIQREEEFQKLFDKYKHLFDMKCDCCSEVFEYFDEGRNHYLTVHNNTRGYIKCCGLRLHYPCQVEAHLDRHLEPDKYKCKECGRMLSSVREVERHMKQHSDEINHEPVTCNVCNEVFKSKRGLFGHMKRHKKSKRSDEEATFMADTFDMTCDQCDAIFITFDEARTHYKEFHNDDKGYVKCCGIKLKKTWQIRDHIKSHLNPDSFKCEKCGKNFLSRMILVQHRRRHRLALDESFICDYCGKAFRDKDVLKCHLFSKHVKSEPTNECPICHKKFHLKCQLRNHHYSAHREKKPSYTCEICGKSFLLKFHLDQHMQLHADKSERLAQRKQCEYCGEWLLTRSGLYYHEKIHNSQPQKCEQCDKILPHRIALLTHIRSVHRERNFKCNFCDKRFDIASRLKTHEACHTREEIHSCTDCSKSFSLLSSLTMHMKRKHR